MTWDKIAKTGSYKDMNGNNHTFTKESFQQIVDKYKSAPCKAPVVFGHPATNDPAQGWISEIRVNGDFMEARYENIKPDAARAVINKDYKYKSMALNADGTLRHVGWLGAVPPAMDGLGEITFAQANEKGITLYFAGEINTGGHNNMDDKTLEVVAKAQEDVKERERKIADLQEQIKALQEQLKELTEKKEEAEEKVETVQAEFAKFKEDTVHSARTRRIDALIASGRLSPAEREKVLTMATVLGANATANFSSSDGKSISVEEQYLRDLESAQPSNLFSGFTAPVGAEPVQISAKQMVSKL